MTERERRVRDMARVREGGREGGRGPGREKGKREVGREGRLKGRNSREGGKGTQEERQWREKEESDQGREMGIDGQCRWGDESRRK